MGHRERNHLIFKNMISPKICSKSNLVLSDLRLRHSERRVTRASSLKMSYFAFDTETTGLPATRARPVADNISNWDNCRMLSMAIVKFNSEHKVIDQYHGIVYPDNFEVDATHIHGITKEQALKEGKPFEELYNIFLAMVHECPVMVGHNISFDVNIMKAEAIRRGLDQSVFDIVEPVCTLDLAKSIYLKPFKLGVLYEQLFKKPLDGAHNALADSVAAGEVYAKLIEDPREYNFLPVRKVIIKASDVAACVGMHSYKSSIDVVDEMWKKYHPINFQGETRDDRSLKALEHSDDAQRLLKAALLLKPRSSEEVKELVDVSIDIIKNDNKLDQEQKRYVCDHIRKMIYTHHGTNNEDVTADLDDSNLVRDDTFYKYTVTNIRGTVYEIVGRIDRLQINQDGTKTLVEIKNRVNSLFHKVKLYEMVQVQTYLQMLPDVVEARLVEQHNSERNHYIISRDQACWDDKILPKLVEFCKTLHHYMSS